MMTTGSKTMVIIASMMAVLEMKGSTTLQVHGISNNPGNNGNPNWNRNYSLNQQISFDPTQDQVNVEGETEATAFYNDDADVVSDAGEEQQDGHEQQQQQQKQQQEREQHMSKSPLANSNTNNSNNSGFTSSSVAMLCSGGDISTSPFVAMAECAFVPTAQHHMMDSDYEDDDEDEDDDDDDDDDNDGHSSMLSNASLRRSLASANGANGYDASNNHHRRNVNANSKANARPTAYTTSTYNPDTSTLQMGSATAATKPTTLFQRSRRNHHHHHIHRNSHSTPLSTALQVRGGATAIPAGTPPEEFLKRLIVAALVTLLYEGSIGHLLEFLKIVMQTAPPGTTYLSILRDITAEKGIAGTWDGFVPWGVIQSIGKGGVFGLAHAVALSKLVPLAEGEDAILPRQLALTLAGGIAGGFQGYVLSPLLLLKTRVMTDPIFRESMSMLRTTLLSLTIGFDVVKNEGLLALMKGSNIFALKRVFDWSTRYFFSDMFELLLLNASSASTSLSPGQKIAASLLGGSASTLVTLPLDVLVANTQSAKKAGVKVSAWEMFVKDYREGGWKGLRDANMRGFEARLLHVCFTTVAMKTGTGLMYDFLYGAKKE